MPRERQRFCGGEGGEDRTPGRLKTRGFDLLIKEDCAGSLAASTGWQGLDAFFGEEPQVRRKAVLVPVAGGVGVGRGVQWMGWVEPTESRRQGFALVEEGKKRGREETGNVGAG